MILYYKEERWVKIVLFSEIEFKEIANTSKIEFNDNPILI